MSYDLVEREVATGRQLEARVLLRSAMRLNDAITGTNADDLFTAVSLNNRLWLLFASEIDRGAVSLPPEVARNILQLASFVVTSAPRAFARDRATLEALVNINRRIAAGLSVEVEGAEQAQPAAASGERRSAGFATSA